MEENDENGNDEDSGENDVIDEKLTTRQALLLYGYQPTMLPWNVAIECGDEKAESAN